ncbi:periplasmic substrate-binding domain-containing protein [Hydrogenophaga soli]
MSFTHAPEPVPRHPTQARVSTWFLKLVALWLSALVWTSAWAAREDLRLGLTLEPPSLDPTTVAAASIGEMLYANVFEGLTVLDAEGHIAPRLATSWVLSADRLQLDLYLRANVRFHDGRPFNAEVAAWSIQRILAADSKNPQKKWFERVQTAQAVGANRLRLSLRAPDPFLPFALALPAAVMVHPDHVATVDQQPVGTGPFRFSRWDKGAKLVLDHNPLYWGRQPALTHVEFVFVGGRTEGESLLLEGALDGLISVTDRVQNFQGRPDIQVLRRQVEQKVLLAINNERPPFNDLRVRRALSHGIRRDPFKVFYGEDLQPAYIGSHFAPTHPAYVDLVQRYPHDAALARSLLKAAGVKPGTKVALVAPPTRYGRIGSVSITEDLENLGFQVEVQNLGWKDWLAQVFNKKDYALSIIAHVEPMDLNIYARDGYYFNYDNAAFKKLWDQTMDAPNEAELNRLLGQAQRRIADDAVNVFLFMVPQTFVLNRKLQGFWVNTPLPTTVLEDVRWAN